MARPRKFAPSITLEKLLGVFWSRGYEATSLSDITSATGLGKGSLYATFGDKRAMFFQALASYDSKYVDGAVTLMSALHGEDALRAFLDLPAQAVETGDHRGCFLCNATMETSLLDEQSFQLAEASRAKLLSALRKAYAEARPATNRIDVSVAANQILAFYFGLRVLARGGESARAIRTTAKGYRLP